MMSRVKRILQPEPMKTCNGKNCYKSEREAEIVAAEQELSDLCGELEIKVYRCIDCGFWHLTRNKNKV